MEGATKVRLDLSPATSQLRAIYTPEVAHLRTIVDLFQDSPVVVQLSSGTNHTSSDLLSKRLIPIQFGLEQPKQVRSDGRYARWRFEGSDYVQVSVRQYRQLRISIWMIFR